MIFLLEALYLCWNFKKNVLPVVGISHMAWAYPRAFILNIDGATDHSVYKVAVDPKQQQLQFIT